jgi:hypothetical protein
VAKNKRHDVTWTFGALRVALLRGEAARCEGLLDHLVREYSAPSDQYHMFVDECLEALLDAAEEVFLTEGQLKRARARRDAAAQEGIAILTKQPADRAVKQVGTLLRTAERDYRRAIKGVSAGSIDPAMAEVFWGIWALLDSALVRLADAHADSIARSAYSVLAMALKHPQGIDALVRCRERVTARRERLA